MGRQRTKTIERVLFSEPEIAQNGKELSITASFIGSDADWEKARRILAEQERATIEYLDSL